MIIPLQPIKLENTGGIVTRSRKATPAKGTSNDEKSILQTSTKKSAGRH